MERVCSDISPFFSGIDRHYGLDCNFFSAMSILKGSHE